MCWRCQSSEARDTRLRSARTRGGFAVLLGTPVLPWGVWGFATCSPRLGSNVQALSRAGNELRVRAGVLQ